MRLLASFSAVVLLLMLSPGVAIADATADPDQGVNRERVLQIVTAADPESLMAELTEDEQDEMLTVIEDNLVADAATAEVTALSPAEAELVGRKYPKTKGRDPTRLLQQRQVVGRTTTTPSLVPAGPSAESWMQLNWCASNGPIPGSSFLTSEATHPW